jgi:DNA-binding transcriptional LysR family regulator
MLPLIPLRTLRRLAEVPNFPRVAEDLHLTQPAVSQHVRVLSAHFGVPLVEVVGRRAALTDAGRFLVERAGPILGAVDALERDMREYAAARVGELRVGASETVGNYVLPALLARFAASHPAIRVEAEVGNTTEMIARLRAGALALALVEGEASGTDLTAQPFADDELQLILPVTHALAARRVVALGDLAGEPFVAREAGSGTRALFESTLRDAGVAPRIVIELPSGEAVARAVAAGLGLAVLSRRVAEDALARGRVASASIHGVRFARTFRIVRLVHHALSPAARAFVATTGAGDALSAWR